MKIVILNGFQTKQESVDLLCARMMDEGHQTHLLHLKDYNIKGCVSCGGCSMKTPGQCVLHDDLHEVMQSVVDSDVLVLATPVRWGAVSPLMKRTLDRFMLLGLPLYESRNGRLYHPGRYAPKRMLVVGVTAHTDRQERQNFVLTMNRVAENLLYQKRVVLKESNQWLSCPAESAQGVHAVLQELLKDNQPEAILHSLPELTQADTGITPSPGSRFVIVNGSPRRKGTSAMLGSALVEKLTAHGSSAVLLHATELENEANWSKWKVLLTESHGLALFSPLYVDSLPQPLLQALELIRNQMPDGLKGKSLTGLVQCGFPDQRMLEPALGSMRLFAREAGMQWLGGLAHGGGAMINGTPLPKLGKKGRRFDEALSLMASHMQSGVALDSRAQTLIAARFPKILQVPCCMMLNQMHLRQARKLGLDVFAQPFLHSGEAKWEHSLS